MVKSKYKENDLDVIFSSSGKNSPEFLSILEKMVGSLCYNYSGYTDDEIISECYVEVYKKIDLYDPDKAAKGGIKSFIHTLIRNAITKYTSRKKTLDTKEPAQIEDSDSIEFSNYNTNQDDLYSFDKHLYVRLFIEQSMSDFKRIEITLPDDKSIEEVVDAYPSLKKYLNWRMISNGIEVGAI